MTKCATCKKQWTGILLFKAHFASANGVECDYCHNTQYVSEKSKKKMIIPLLLVTVVLLIGLFAPPSITQYFWVYITITARSEEHTSELQSRFDLVCRLLLEK